MFWLFSVLTFLPVSAQDWGDTEKITAVIGTTSHRDLNDRFSGQINALDIDENRAVVGSEFENQNATNTSNINDAGAAFIIEYDGNGDWRNDTKLVAGSSRGNGDRFGHSVAIAGNYVVVGVPFDDHPGASNGGSIYIYEYTSGWTEIGRFTASDVSAGDNFGWSLGIHSDVIIVGSPNNDLNASGGGTPISDAGAVYFFDIEGNQLDKVVYADRASDDHFGWDVDIHMSDNEFALVGAPDEDENSVGGKTENGAGSAFILRPSGSVSNWVVHQKIVPTDRDEGDRFGYSVALDDNYAIIGADQDEHNSAGSGAISNAGSAYIFNYGTTWTEQAKLEAQNRSENDRFGVSVGISGNYAIVGAYADDQDAGGGNTLANAGSAEVFQRNGTSWSSFEKLDASDRASNDEFGWSVAINGDFAAVGEQFEDELANGTGTVSAAGSVYFSALCENPVITTDLQNKLYCADYPENLSIAVFSNHIVQYQWYRDGTPPVTIGSNSPSLSVNSNGSYYCEITITACSSSFKVTSNTIEVTTSPPPGVSCSGGGGSRLGLFETDNSIYPNPANDIIFIRGKEISGVRLFDQMGRAITISISKNNNITSINTSHLPQGFYMIKYMTDMGIERKRVSIRH